MADSDAALVARIRRISTRQSWGIDSNRADRLFEKVVRRLTRVDSKSVEEVIDVDDGPMFDYPWLYAVEVGHWEFKPHRRSISVSIWIAEVS